LSRFQETWQRNPSGTHNASEVDSSNRKVLRVALRKLPKTNAKNCSLSQQHAVAEKPEHLGDAGSVVMRSSKSMRLPIRLVPERNQNAQIGANNQEFLP
jgi:hypothetical protein